jgi:NAD(P)-dependent dehydrogenase (short-subunit alcohol dehydrogenase family)
MANQSKEDTMPQRRVLITGASKGIGRAAADRVAAAGHLPIGLARTGPEDFPGEFYEVDLADRAATAEVLDKSSRAGGSMPWSTTPASRGSPESARSTLTICSAPTT